MRTVFVEGTRITLTPEQEAQVNKELRRRKKNRSSFEKMLKYLGFKPAGEGLRNCWQHEKENWWAEVHDQGHYHTVWLVGPGLKCGGFPGGWSYGEPEEIEMEVLKALKKI